MAAAITVAVDDDPVVVVSTAPGPRRSVAVHNLGTGTVYLGGSTVASTTGWPLGSGDDVTLDLGENELLYGVCAAAATATLRVLTAGV